MWHELTLAGSKERYLQDLFDDWKQPVGRRAGVPAWLRAFAGPNQRTRRKAFGYEFIPDVEYQIAARHYIIELKRAPKYEPLALAEVLHHAEWVRRYGAAAGEVIPVIVTTFSSWLRLAIAALPQRTDGFGALRYYEVDVLHGGGEDIVWFDEPLAAWTPTERPAFLRDYPASARLHWHYVPSTRSWIGMEQLVEERPVILEEPYVMVSELDRGDFVLWEGAPAKNHTRNTGPTTSRYFAWSAQGSASRHPPDAEPTWLGRGA